MGHCVNIKWSIKLNAEIPKCKQENLTLQHGMIYCGITDNASVNNHTKINTTSLSSSFVSLQKWFAIFYEYYHVFNFWI